MWLFFCRFVHNKNLLFIPVSSNFVYGSFDINDRNYSINLPIILWWNVEFRICIVSNRPSILLTTDCNHCWCYRNCVSNITNEMKMYNPLSWNDSEASHAEQKTALISGNYYFTRIGEQCSGKKTCIDFTWQSFLLVTYNTNLKMWTHWVQDSLALSHSLCHDWRQ